MPFYNYKARDEKSAVATGLVEAPTAIAAARILRERGWFVISIAPARETIASNIRAVFSRVGFGEIVTFTRQLSTMVNAGLSLTESLHILERQMSQTSLRKIISDILRQIESGASFSQAIERYGDLFSPIYRALIRAGEASGMLDNVLSRLADNLEREKEFRGKIRSALIYPTIIIIGMIALMLIMVVFVVPKLTDLYKDFGSDLPLPTQILVFLSRIIIGYWWIAVLILVALPIIYARFKVTEVGKIFIDRVSLSLPVFGDLQKKALLVEFARTSGILVGAGVPILDSLEILGSSLGSHQFQTGIKDVAQRVEKGAGLGEAINVNPIFPPIVSQMIKIGESTGKLDEILGKLSRYYELEVEQATKTLTTSLEPLIMVVLGIGVGLLVWAVITPIYSLTSKFQ